MSIKLSLLIFRFYISHIFYFEFIMIGIKSLFMTFFEDLDATQPQLDVKFSV